MGKKNQKKKNQEAAAAIAAAANTTPAKETKAAQPAENDAANEESKADAGPVEVQKSAEERADDYKTSALEIHAKYCAQWMDEENKLDEDMDLTEGNKILEKKTNDEVKKLEKLMKKEQNEFEDLTGTGASNVKMVYDKLIRTLKNSKSVTKEANKMSKEAADLSENMTQSKENIQSCIKKKKMLTMICDTFLNQNFELYKQHEIMLDEEKAKRATLASSFQEKMNKLSSDISVNKDSRQKEYEINQEIRNKISEAIETYKSKETDYKTSMETLNSKIKTFQDDPMMKTMEKEKLIYERTNDNVGKLSEEIQSYIKKFDQVKVDIEDRGKKFERYKQEIEEKRLQMQLLETEIQNILAKNEIKNKTRQEVEYEKELLAKQVDTLKKLNGALKSQLQSIQ